MFQTRIQLLDRSIDLPFYRTYVHEISVYCYFTTCPSEILCILFPRVWSPRLCVCVCVCMCACRVCARVYAMLCTGVPRISRRLGKPFPPRSISRIRVLSVHTSLVYVFVYARVTARRVSVRLSASACVVGTGSTRSMEQLYRNNWNREYVRTSSSEGKCSSGTREAESPLPRLQPCSFQVQVRDTPVCTIIDPE